MLIRFLGTKFQSPEARVGENKYPMVKNRRGHWLIAVDDARDSGLFLAMSETWRQYNEAEEVARDEAAALARAEAEAELDDDDNDDGAGEGDQDEIDRLKAAAAKLDEAAARAVAKDKARKAAVKAKKTGATAGVKVPAKKATEKPAEQDASAEKPATGVRFIPDDQDANSADKAE